MSEQTNYRIRIAGHLDDHWSARFSGFTVSREEPDITVLTGTAQDQAALHGVLRTVRDLGMPLISVTGLDGNGSGDLLMRAVAATRYGGPEQLALERMARPAPAPGEVLVRVHAASVNRSDAMAIRGTPVFMRLAGGGILKPRNPIPGADIAGRVAALGEGVTEFAVGDAVFGDLSPHGRGGFAEFVSAPVEALVPMPEGLDFETAAALPTAAVTALQALRDVARVTPGDQVLLEGASGGVGSAAIQIARILGGSVTAVVGPSRIDAARRLGAHHVIDYRATDFTAQDSSYDVIYAVNGHHRPAAYKGVLAPKGRFVMTGGTGSLMVGTLLSGKRFAFHSMKPERSDLSYLGELAAAGTLTTPIDRRYPLEEVAEAIRYLEGGHAAGKVIIAILNAQETHT